MSDQAGSKGMREAEELLREFEDCHSIKHKPELRAEILRRLALVSQPEPRLHKAAERGKLWASRRTTEATDRLGIVYVDDRLLRMVCSEAVPSLDGKRHEWKFFADETARCLRCGLHVPAASAPFHIHNCTATCVGERGSRG